MAAYRLPDHLGVCEIDRRTVMLDLRRDRYFQLDSRTASAFRSCREAPDGSAAGDSAVPELVKRRWLVPLDGAPAPVRTIPDVRRRSLIGELPHVPPTFAIFRGVVSALWSCRRALKRRGLENAAEEARRRKPSAEDGSDLHLHLAAFRAARRLVPMAPNCLTDSLALSAFLAARGFRSDLVFGVKLDPFAAHCWLQNEEAILNDAADSVSDFTPILAV